MFLSTVLFFFHRKGLQLRARFKSYFYGSNVAWYTQIDLKTVLVKAYLRLTHHLRNSQVAAHRNHSFTCYPTEVTFPLWTPADAGTRFLGYWFERVLGEYLDQGYCGLCGGQAKIQPSSYGFGDCETGGWRLVPRWRHKMEEVKTYLSFWMGKLKKPTEQYLTLPLLYAQKSLMWTRGAKVVG